MADSETWATRAFATGLEKDGQGSSEAAQKEETPLKVGQRVFVTSRQSAGSICDIFENGERFSVEIDDEASPFCGSLVHASREELEAVVLTKDGLRTYEPAEIDAMLSTRESTGTLDTRQRFAVNERVLCKAWPCDGKYGVVVDPSDTSAMPMRHPEKTVLVQVQGESYCLHFAPDELVKVSEPAHADIAIGDKVAVVAGPHAHHFLDKISEVMKLREDVAYIQHPPPSPEGTEADAVITTAYVKVEHLQNVIMQQVEVQLQRSKAMLARRQAEAASHSHPLAHAGDLDKALRAWLGTQEGRKALAAKDCHTWKLCDVLGLTGSRTECEQIRVAMVRLGYRNERVSGSAHKSWVLGQIPTQYAEETTERIADMLETSIPPWLTSVAGAAVVHAGRCTTVCICEALGLDLEFATQARVARVMRKLGYKREHRTVGGIGLFVWLPSDGEQATRRAESARLSQPSKTGDKQEETPRYSLPLLTDLFVLMSWLFGFLKSDLLMILLNTLHKLGTLPTCNENGVDAATIKTGSRAMYQFALECERLGIEWPEDLTVYLMQAKLDASDAEFASYQMSMRYQLYANECKRRGEMPSIISRDALNGWLMMLSDVADDIRGDCERQENQGSEWISDEEADLDALIYIVNVFGGRPTGEAATQARRRRMNKVATREPERPTGV